MAVHVLGHCFVFAGTFLMVLRYAGTLSCFLIILLVVFPIFFCDFELKADNLSR